MKMKQSQKLPKGYKKAARKVSAQRKVDLESKEAAVLRTGYKEIQGKQDLKERFKRAEKMANLHWGKSLTTKELGKKFGISTTYAFLELGNFGFPVKTSQEAKDHYWKSLSEKERKEDSERRSKIMQQLWENMTKKEKEDFSRMVSNARKKIWTNMSEKERQKEIDRLIKLRENYFANVSLEELARINLGRSVGMKKHWESMNPKQREIEILKRYESLQDYWSSMTLEERIVDSARRSEVSTHFWVNVSDEERSRIAKKVSNTLATQFRNLPKALQEQLSNTYKLIKAKKISNEEASFIMFDFWDRVHSLPDNKNPYKTEYGKSKRGKKS